VPDKLIASSHRALLGRDSCESDGQLCVPTEMLQNTPAAQCTVSLNGSEGRCLAACLPQVASQADKLQRESCAEHQRCVPCFDPLTGQATGACLGQPDVGTSGTPLATCCEDRGRCLPKSALSSEQASNFDARDCNDSEQLCVPMPFLDSEFKPAMCTVAALGAEGRCLPRCLPSIEAQAQRLAQDGCPRDQLCAPCFDPLTGEPTGACAFPGDPGPSASATVLGECCGDLGRCTPRVWVPEAQQPLFDRGGCDSDFDALCVAPDEALTDASFVPESCTDTRTRAEGRCLPSCLPQVAERASVLTRAQCATEHLCVPCFDPISGDSTGACNTGNDRPQEPKVAFATCCGNGSDASGLCVPSSLLPSDLPALPRQTCDGSDSVCAPRRLVEDPNGSLDSCTTAIATRGVCIQACYLDSTTQVALTRGNCSLGWLCAPCSLLPALPGC
jgi:hypothetical protein